MKRALLAMLFAVALTGQVNPTYIIDPRKPHDPSGARCKIEQFVDALNARDLERLSAVQIVDDSVGLVEPENAAKFFASFDVGSKVSPEDPVKVTSLDVIKVNAAYPIYAATFERRYVPGRSIESRYRATWLIEFEMDNVRIARRADEFWWTNRNGSFASPSCEKDRG